MSKECPASHGPYSRFNQLTEPHCSEASLYSSAVRIIRDHAAIPEDAGKCGRQGSNQNGRDPCGKAAKGPQPRRSCRQAAQRAEEQEPANRRRSL